jgi:hypothetical protein
MRTTASRQQRPFQALRQEFRIDEDFDTASNARLPSELGRNLRVFTATNAPEIEAAFASLSRERVGALLVRGDPYFDGERERLVSLAARCAVPTVYQWREFAMIELHEPVRFSDACSLRRSRSAAQLNAGKRRAI